MNDTCDLAIIGGGAAEFGVPHLCVSGSVLLIAETPR